MYLSTYGSGSALISGFFIQTHTKSDPKNDVKKWQKMTPKNGGKMTQKMTNDPPKRHYTRRINIQVTLHALQNQLNIQWT